MARVRVSLAAQAFDEWAEIAKKMRNKKAYRKKFRDNIVAAGKPILGEVQEAVLRVHTVTSHGHSVDRLVWVPARQGSHGGGTSRRHTGAVLGAGRRAKKSGRNVRAAIERASRRRVLGLRESIARATKLQITGRGVKFHVVSAQLPESQKNLPRLLDSDKGWRHPVFGNREDWVDQKGQPYFGQTIKRRAPEFRRAIEKAMGEIQTDLS
jgi:hypothetical protein